MALRSASAHQEEQIIRRVRWAFSAGTALLSGLLAFPLHPLVGAVASLAGGLLGGLWLYRQAVVVLARKWSLEEPARTTRIAFAFYLAALESSRLDDISRARIERCLVESDVAAGIFSPNRVAVYRRRFSVHVDDPGAAFLLAAAYKQGWLPQDEQMVAVWLRVLRQDWETSPLWERFGLSRVKLLEELANLIVQQGNVTPECVEVVAQAYAANPNHTGWLTYLARAFPPRTDAAALRVYYAFFKRSPRDRENTVFLADYVSENLQGKPWEAEVLQAAIPLHADRRERYILALARCYMRMRHFGEETVAVYREAYALEPQDKQLAVALALALARQHLYDEQSEPLYAEVHKGEQQFAPIVEEMGGSIGEIVVALAHCLAQRGVQNKTALRIYAKALQHAPADGVVAGVYARALARAEDYSEKALPVYIAAHKQYPQDPDLLVALSKAYAHNGATHHEATHVYQKVLHTRLEWEGMCEQLARLYAQERRPPELALQLWKRLAEEQPDNAQVRKWIAAEYLRRREAKNALAYYQVAAEIAPDDFEAQLMTGKLLLQYTNDLSGALQALQAAVGLQPLHLEANLLLGDVLARMEVYPAALTVFEHILDNIDNNCVHALRMAAQMKHLTDHDVLAAAMLYERAVTIEPENIEVWKEFAEFAKDHGMVDREIRALATLTRLDPRESAYHVRLGELYVIDGDFRHAEEHLRQAIALGAQGQTVFTLLGEVATRVRRSA